MDKAHAAEIDWARCSPVFDAARTIEDPSFVYVVAEGSAGPLKIGVAKDPVTRLRSMQTGNSRRLRIEAVVIGDRAVVEALLHEIWEPFAIRSVRKQGKADTKPGTEWFKTEIRDDLFLALATAVADQLRYIKEVQNSDPPGELNYAEFGRVVLTAHRKHELEIHRRDEVHIPAQGAGYVVKRRSIIQAIDNMIDEAEWERRKAALAAA